MYGEQHQCSVLSAHCSLLVFAIAHSLGVRLNNPNRPKPVTPPVAMDRGRQEGREGGRGTDREWMTPFHLIPCHPPIRPIVKRTVRMHFRQPQEANVKRRTAIQENNDQPCMQIPSGEEHRVWDRTFWAPKLRGNLLRIFNEGIFKSFFTELSCELT